MRYTLRRTATALVAATLLTWTASTAPSQPSTGAKDGGLAPTIASVTFTGNTRLPRQTLREHVIADVVLANQPYDPEVAEWDIASLWKSSTNPGPLPRRNGAHPGVLRRAAGSRGRPRSLARFGG